MKNFKSPKNHSFKLPKSSCKSCEDNRCSIIDEKILTIQLNANQQEPIAINLTAKQANYLATTLSNLSASDPDADHWVKTTIIIND